MTTKATMTTRYIPIYWSNRRHSMVAFTTATGSKEATCIFPQFLAGSVFDRAGRIEVTIESRGNFTFYLVAAFSALQVKDENNIVAGKRIAEYIFPAERYNVEFFRSDEDLDKD